MLLFLMMFGTIAVFAAVSNNKVEQKIEPTPSIYILPYDTKMENVEDTQISTVAVEPVETVEVVKQYIYYDVPLTDEFQRYIQDVCEQYGFERYDIVIALIGHESSYRQTVVSSTNDYGYMQINTVNHEWLSELLGITDFLDGEQNVEAGIYLLDNLVDKYDDVGLALMCYNCGECGAKQLWEQGIYSTSYSRSIQEEAEALEERTGG